MSFPRRTKLARYKRADGGIVHMGDLVGIDWAAGTQAERRIEGEVVDIQRHQVVIEWGDADNPRYSFIHANHVEIICCAKESKQS